MLLVRATSYHSYCTMNKITDCHLYIWKTRQKRDTLKRISYVKRRFHNQATTMGFSRSGISPMSRENSINAAHFSTSHFWWCKINWKRVVTSVYSLSTLKINDNCMCTHTFHLLIFREKFCAIQVYRNITVCCSVDGEEIPLLENPILKYVDMLFQMTLSRKLTSTIDLLVRAVTML